MVYYTTLVIFGHEVLRSPHEKHELFNRKDFLRAGYKNILFTKNHCTVTIK